MGVDWYACKICKEAFPDCGNFWSCEYCGSMFCSTDCGEPAPLEDNEDKMNCCLCRKETATDNQLLHFLLEHCNLTYDQVMEMYRKQED